MSVGKMLLSPLWLDVCHRDRENGRIKEMRRNGSMNSLLSSTHIWSFSPELIPTSGHQCPSPALNPFQPL
jgi:hypothetical protein